MRQLNQEGKYTALTVNIQAAARGRDAERAMQMVVADIYSRARQLLPELEYPVVPTEFSSQLGGFLKSYLQHWATQNPKPIVLFIDEANSLMDDLFLALLCQLRAGFEARPKGFPQAVALVGLRDVRDYKIRLRPERDSLGTGSPFNVKTKSLFMRGFTPAEVNLLLDQHTLATGQVFPREVREEIYRLSQGQPWLTNALANQIVAEVLHNDYQQPITVVHVIQAKEELIQRRDTHLDSLIDKLREPQVKRVVTAILNGDAPTFDELNDAILYTRDLGLIAPKPPVRFANPIYQEIIPRVLGFGFEEFLPEDVVDPQWYIQQGRLNLEALLVSVSGFLPRTFGSVVGQI